jgi:hypothetical protein
MTRTEQKEFVRNLTESVAMHILQNIDNMKVPENWDGIELRWLLEMEFTNESRYGNRKESRRRKFLNDWNVNNL